VDKIFCEKHDDFLTKIDSFLTKSFFLFIDSERTWH